MRENRRDVVRKTVCNRGIRGGEGEKVKTLCAMSSGSWREDAGFSGRRRGAAGGQHLDDGSAAVGDGYGGEAQARDPNRCVDAQSESPVARVRGDDVIGELGRELLSDVVEQTPSAVDVFG